MPRGDKKRKKEVMEQIAQLEVELDARHKQELQDLEAGKDPEVNWLYISYTHRWDSVSIFSLSPECKELCGLKASLDNNNNK